MCACKEECVTVKVTDKKVKLQKHLLLSNITELYLEFRDLMTKPIGSLQVPPLKFVEQIV